jgi:hypothetical protein
MVPFFAECCRLVKFGSTFSLVGSAMGSILHNLSLVHPGSLLWLVLDPSADQIKPFVSTLVPAHVLGISLARIRPLGWLFKGLPRW